MGIRESTLNTITALTNSDFVRMVTAAGASRKASLQSVAQHILETYTGTSLAGSNQSVKDAIDGLNSTFAIEDFTSDTVTIAGGGRSGISIPCAKTGYAVVGVIGVYVGATDVFSVSEFYRYSDTAVGVVMYNSYAEARSAAVRATVLFKKNS